MSSYRRVSQRDDVAANSSRDNLEASQMRSRTERLTDKVTASKSFSCFCLFYHASALILMVICLFPVAWIAVAVIVARWSSFFLVIWKSDEANRFLLRIAALGLGVVTSLVLYLTVYLPRVKGLKADSAAWNVYCPKVIPTITVVCILSYLIALRGTWSVWGYLSPFIYGTQFMGALMAMHFVPALGLC